FLNNFNLKILSNFLGSVQKRKFGLFAFSATDIRGNAMRTEIVAAKHDEKSQKKLGISKKKIPKATSP
ncbi:hypothetical protein, partial [Anaerotignum lactatifermentans]